MKPHTKIYFKTLGYDITDFIPSEISGGKAVDIHHIECKGMGGNPSKSKDRIENLQALTREEHLKYGDKHKYMAFLYKKHLVFLKKSKVVFDEEYIKTQIKKYE